MTRVQRDSPRNEGDDPCCDILPTGLIQGYRAQSRHHAGCPVVRLRPVLSFILLFSPMCSSRDSSIRTQVLLSVRKRTGRIERLPIRPFQESPPLLFQPYLPGPSLLTHPSPAIPNSPGRQTRAPLASSLPLLPSGTTSLVGDLPASLCGRRLSSCDACRTSSDRRSGPSGS